MARQKKSITHGKLATVRLAALKSIDPTADYGGDLTIVKYEAQIVDLTATVSSYNTLLSQVDQIYNLMLVKDEALRDTSERMLLAVAAKYGKNSSEYEMAGGTRKSEHKKAKAKTPPTA
ncbi:MAG: hypothetical protein RI894_1188 [Bacteroidota bacterium]|jgi:hypothetical protein